MQWGQGWLARVEAADRRVNARIEAEYVKVKTLTKAALGWLASRFSIVVEQGNDLWTIWWGVRLDLGTYSFYLGMAKDKA